MTRGPAPADCRRPRFALFPMLWLATVLGACVLLTGAAWADRLHAVIPWNESTTPPLALNDLAGRPHTLADYQGSVVLVNFWATWCEPCREEMASMRALHQRLTGRPFAILLVNFGETRMRVSEFVKRESLTFLDPPGSKSGCVAGLDVSACCRRAFWSARTAVCVTG